MKCRFCKKIKDNLKNDSTTYYKGKVYKYYSCRDCNTARMKKYRQSENGKEVITRLAKKYYKQNKESRKRFAWQKAQKVQKKVCEVCGDKNVHRHHYDYNKPLDVKFLCPYHHKAEHNNML